LQPKPQLASGYCYFDRLHFLAQGQDLQRSECPLRPSECSGLPLDLWRYRLESSSSGIGCPFRVSDLSKYRPYRLGVPTLPLAVPSAVWSFLDRLRRSQLSDQQHPLVGFHLPLESCPTNPSRPAAANQRLSWAFLPYSTSGTEGPLTTGLPDPLRSAFRVWLPS
jgi:hypothetical protein